MRAQMIKNSLSSLRLQIARDVSTTPIVGQFMAIRICLLCNESEVTAPVITSFTTHIVPHISYLYIFEHLWAYKFTILLVLFTLQAFKRQLCRYFYR